MDSLQTEAHSEASHSELLVTYDMQLTGADGQRYAPEVHIQRQPNDDWLAWVEFAAASGKSRLLTQLETSNKDRDAIVEWAKALPTTELDDVLHTASSSFQTP